jgi:Urea transporter
MGVRCSNSFADSGRFFAHALLVGLSQLALCRNAWVGVLIAGTLFAFSPHGFALGLWGGAIATGWAVWRQRDSRLVMTGWYGANGILCGLWLGWLLPGGLVTALVVAVGALAMAVVLDLIVYPLGDAPLRLPPLTLPLVLLAAIIMPTAPALLDTFEDLRAQIRPAANNGWSAYQDQDFKQAARLFQTAPAWTDPLYGLGWVSLWQRHPTESAEYFTAALAREPARDDIRLGLGWALLAAHRPAEGENLFLDLLRRNPSNAPALQGVADCRRALIIHGETRAADPVEWLALGRMFGWKVLLIPLVALAVLIQAPRPAVTGLTVAGLGMAVSVALAGPASLLWIDLHLQTLALLGFLVAEKYHSGASAPNPDWRRCLQTSLVFINKTKGGLGHRPKWAWAIAQLFLATLAGTALWVIAFRLGIWTPLLSFNIVGLGALLVLHPLQPPINFPNGVIDTQGQGAQRQLT